MPSAEELRTFSEALVRGDLVATAFFLSRYPFHADMLQGAARHRYTTVEYEQPTRTYRRLGRAHEGA